jgi:ribosomal protein S18 acetylase RimI-like enzyme
MPIEPDLPIALRAEEPGDEDFLLTVYASTREEELNATGWPAEARNAFVAMQFRAMRQGYKVTFPQAQFSVILLSRQPVGRIVIDRAGQQIELVDISLLAACRAQGIGTLVIRRLLDEAEKAKKTVSLKVVQHNRAARLYERLGFQFTDQSGIYQTMEWRSGRQSSR